MKNAEPALSLVFGGIHGIVSRHENCVFIRSIVRKNRNAYADTNSHKLLPHLDRPAHLINDISGYFFRRFQRIHLFAFQQNRKLIPAHPKSRAFCTNTVADAFSRG